MSVSLQIQQLHCEVWTLSLTVSFLYAIAYDSAIYAIAYDTAELEANIQESCLKLKASLYLKIYIKI